MNSALLFDGVNDYATLNQAEDFGDTGEYVIELSFKIDADTVNDIQSILHGQDYFYYRLSNSRFFWSFSGSSVQLTGVDPVDILGTDQIIELRQDSSGNKEVYSPIFGLDNFIGVRNFNFDKFVRNGNWQLDGALYSVKVYSDLAKTNLIRNWSPDDSDRGPGTPVLVETITGNDATGVNMPTDGSAWQSGGGGSVVIPPESRGTANDIALYLNSLGAFESTQVNDIIVEWLRSEGATGETLNDLFYDYWLQQGLIGSYTDKQDQWRRE